MELGCSLMGTVLRVRSEWRVRESCELEECSAWWRSTSQSVPDPLPPLREAHLSLGPPSQLFLPVSIWTPSEFPFNDNNSNNNNNKNKWKLCLRISPLPFHSQTSQKSLLCALVPRLPINVSAYFSLAVIPIALLKRLSPSSL